MSTEQDFINRQNEIREQIERIDIKLSFYKKWHDKNFGDSFDNLPKEKKEYTRKIAESLPYNYFQDKKEELEDELQSNYIDYQEWHFEKYGWCAF